MQAVGSDNTSGSHFEAQDQMEHGEAQGKTIGGGWIGRHLRTRAGKKMTPLSAVAIGPTVPESLRGAPSVSALRSIDEIQIKTPSNNSRSVSMALSAMYNADIGILKEPGRMTLDLLNRVEALRELEYKPENNTIYPDDEFGSGLREIARLIKADVGLEVACIDLGGWDTHFFQETIYQSQIEPLAQGLAAFDRDLNRYSDDVTVVVMTEFGRRVYENSSFGTDHGRGFAMMVIGNRINGGKVHGKWPGLEEETTDLLGSGGPGGLMINYDYRSVLTEILSGVMGNRNIAGVFPGFQPQMVGLVK